MEYAISNSADELSGQAKEFFEHVQNEQDEPELNNDYPYVFVITVDGDQYIGFKTNLPESREPWTAGLLAFGRDDVIAVNDDGTLDVLVDAATPSVVEDLLDLADI